MYRLSNRLSINEMKNCKCIFSKYFYTVHNKFIYEIRIFLVHSIRCFKVPLTISNNKRNETTCYSTDYTNHVFMLKRNY